MLGYLAIHGGPCSFFFFLFTHPISGPPYTMQLMQAMWTWQGTLLTKVLTSTSKIDGGK